MSISTDNFCTDCKWHEALVNQNQILTNFCGHHELGFYRVPCHEIRDRDGFCGPAGKYFEEREESDE